MRILMLAQSYPPLVGGEERHVRNLSIELASRGHDVAVAIFKEKERRHSPPFPDPEALGALRRIIIRERPDIVHAHNWLVHSFTPLKAWSRARLVVTLHDCSLVCVQQQFLYHGTLCSGPGVAKCLACSAEIYGIAKGVPVTLANWTWGKVEQQAVDMFLPVSNAVAEANQLARREVPYQVIPNFIPDDVSVPLASDAPYLAQLPEGNYLLFVGNVGRDKGVEVLFQAYTAMGSQVPLVLIGQPEIGFVADLPPNVRLLQSWPHHAVMGAWRRCSIALMPSICLDACPTVTMEAMAMGRPVVASRIGGLPDIVIDGETGFLITPGDYWALQEAIQRLLSDHVLRARMGAVAKQRVVQFQAKTVVPRIEEIYREMLQ